MLTGTVLDSLGLPIAGATVEFQSAERSLSVTTEIEGAFQVPVSVPGFLVIRRAGFAPATVSVNAGGPADGFQVRLYPAPAIVRIVVTETGQQEERIPAVPNGQFVFSERHIDASGSQAVDDILRQAPGFSLFRRSSSLFANPTSQGVSMRGIGASGASRAAVLLDGVPLNDPFGGWVYFNQVPRASIGSIQMSNGAASELYGAGAMAGVINLTSRREEHSFGDAEISYGNRDTPFASLAGGLVTGPWAVSLNGQAMRTHGYILVPPDQRGLVDARAGSGDLVASGEIAHRLGSQGRVFLGAASFGESKQNGTRVTNNDTRVSSFRAGADWEHPAAGEFSLRSYGSREIFNQTFSAVAAGRNSERLTNRQRSPSQQVGFAAQWRRTFQARHSVAAGSESRWVRGHSAETTFSLAGPTANVDAGGRQRITGIFVQDAFYFARNWLLTAALRGDFWANTRGFSSRQPLPTGAATASMFPDRRESAFSPRLTILRTLPHNVALSASAYRAFRAPTLNELYRAFRVGNVVTSANADLRAERLTGGEAGVSYHSRAGALTLRGTFFWNHVSDPVANVTLSSSPSLITRQRQNLGALRAAGVELSAEARLSGQVRLSGSYALTDSIVLRFPANAALVGLRVPQVPLHSFNMQIGYADPHWTLGLQSRWNGNQYDDDLNRLPLGRAYIVDGEISRRLTPQAEVFLAAQNLFDADYIIARTPVTNTGPPVMWRGGFRFNWQ